MTLAGAGFVPCEVPCPARVLTAYPCVVRRDPHRPRHVPFGEQIGNGVPCVARRRGVASDAHALFCSSHTVGQQTRLPVSAHGLAMSVGRPAYVPAMRVAGRDYVTSLGTKPAPARVMASANGQPSYDRIM
jgi:hypothetical protein